MSHQEIKPMIYRINVAMAKLGVCRTTIYQMVKRGELDLVQLSRRASGITVESLERLIASHTRSH